MRALVRLFVVLELVSLCSDLVVAGDDPDAQAPARKIAVELLAVPEWRTELLERLRTKRISFEFDSTPFRDVVALIGSVSKIRLEPDDSAAGAMDREITLKVTSLDLRSIFDLVSLSAGVEWGIRDGAVVFAAKGTLDPKFDPRLEVRSYDIRPLATDSRTDALESIVKSFVDADSWESKRPLLRFADGRLVVRHGAETHREVKALLDRMLSPRGDRATWSNERRDVEAILDGPISLEVDDASVESILRMLSDLKRVNVVRDPAWEATTKVTLSVAGVSLRSILEDLARRMGGHVVVRENIVMLSATFDTELCIYDVSALALKGDALLDRVTGAIEAPFWKPVPKPVLWNDLLIVRQSTANLIAIEALLKSLPRAAK